MFNDEKEFDKFRNRYILSSNHKKYVSKYKKILNLLMQTLDDDEKELLFALCDIHIEQSTDYAKSAVRYFKRKSL